MTTGAESEVIDHTFSVADATVTAEGFGIPLIAGFHNFWVETVRAFNAPDEMTVSPYNVPTTHALYIAAQKVMSGNPAPEQFKIGKLTGPITHRVELVPSTPVAGEIYKLKVDGQQITVTADSVPTVAELTAALTTAISALADVTATDGTTKVTVVGDTAGVPHSYEELSSNLKLTETTALPTPTPAADLATIQQADPEWYGLVLANGGEASANNVAAWIETQRKLFIHTTPDSGTYDGTVTTDIGSDLNGASYTRSGVIYHEKPVSEYAGGAWLGVMMPKLPGPATFANKSLPGVTKSPLDATKRNALAAKKINYYTDIKGLGFTLHGYAASGRFFDVTVAMDWFDIGIENRILLLLHNNDIVPYTQKGIELARGQLLGQILEGIALGIIDGEQPYQATAPLVTAVTPTDKGNRLLPDLKYSYVLSGAIHKVKIKGTVQV